MREFKKAALVGAVSGAVALGSFTGCSWSNSKQAKESGRTTAQVSTDKDISDSVSKQLKSAPVYKYPDVHVNTFNGQVQLSGFVHSQGQKDEAARIAQGVPGVTLVHNDLVVQPLTPTGRTNAVNQPYQAPVVTPPQDESVPQNPPPQPSPGSQP